MLSLGDRYTVEDGPVYLSGLQALVRLPLDQRRLDLRRGLRTAGFISGYEGSPLAGYDLELSRRQALLDAHDVVFRPALNEELAADAVTGSQLTAVAGRQRFEGVFGIWYGKAPGLDRATDAIRHGNLGGTHDKGGVLTLVGDDALAKSSTVPSSSEMAMAELGLPTLVPADPQDVLDLGLHGLALSRACGLWAGLKIGTNVADGAAVAQVHPCRISPVAPDATFDGVPWRHTVTARYLQPTLGELEFSFYHRRLEMARRYARANGLNQVVQRTADDRVGIVASGSVYLELRQALSALGLTDDLLSRRGVRLLKLDMVFPLEPTTFDAFAFGLREIVVVEEKRAFVETAVKEHLYGRAEAPMVSGKTAPDGSALLQPQGDLSADTIALALARRLAAHDVPEAAAWLAARATSPVPRPRTALPIVVRTPFFCSGCPHNRSTETPDGSLVGGGIGCSAMTSLMDPKRVGDVIGLTQMGGEGAAWIGMAPFLEDDHLLQNIGDGTFHHSGSLAVRAAVAAGSNITYKLLYNSAVAMTGGQQAVGGLTVPALCQLLVAEGVARIVVTTEDPKRYKGVRLPAGIEVWHRDRLLEAQQELAQVRGVTVLIHDQECATELRRKRKRGLVEEPAQRVFINERVCEGCGDCGAKSNCVSVRPVPTEFGRKTQIHQPSCNKDFSCLDGDCPSFLTVVPAARKQVRRSVPDLAAEVLPTPRPAVPSARFALRITGIGGTGVVTVAQVLATAAVLAGRQVRALDQTGLAQKGGAVISDVKVTSEPTEQANRLSDGECDLYLGCDVLVAADLKNLRVASVDRTVAVVSTTEVPTGAMVVDPAVSFPAQHDVLAAIRAGTRSDKAVFLDARRLTEALFGDDQYANMFLVGAAYQSGALPVPADAIEEAIGLNAVAVDRNRQAFRRGRQAVADPAGLQQAIEALLPQARAPRSVPSAAARVGNLVAAEPGSRLQELVARRVGDLVEYQDARYAERYARAVEDVRVKEAQVRPGSSQLVEAVAQSLHRLMAYKDEYEVARLSLDPALEDELAAQFGPGASYSYRLHPPVLRALGMQRKLSLGRWFRSVFAMLYLARRLRGTRVDPFGRGRVRRVERELIVEFSAVLERLLAGLSPDNHELAVQVAELPDMVRGYEHIKLGNVDRYHAELQQLLAAFDASAPRNAAAVG